MDKLSFLYEPDPISTNWIYDLETFPNIFTAAFLNTRTLERRLFEISDRKNEIQVLLRFLNNLENSNHFLIGFNSMGFDYPIIHLIMELGLSVRIADIYEKAQDIINTPWVNRNKNVIRSPKIKQIDLFKINHFDNMAKSTSLKTLECNMVMDSVEDLPFEVGTDLTHDEMHVLVQYNWHDVDATYMFYRECEHQISLRENLSKKYSKDFTNSSDSKMGSDIFVLNLEKAGIRCYEKSSRGRGKVIQTVRESIALSECIFPYITFEHPEFNRIHQWLKQQVVTETKGVFKDLTCTVEGVEYVIGTGGLHASVSKQLIESNDEYQIVDVDVAAMYPSMAIVNKLYPEHLGVEFCQVYQELFEERKKYPKGSAENAALKIAMNATYGNSGNKYSPFYDLKYLLSTTIGGQLSLLMFVEQLIKTPGLSIVQANTDGITYKVPKVHIAHTRALCVWWEQITGLILEEALYSRFWIKDVNSYIAEYS